VSQHPCLFYYYRGADKSLARPGSKQARKHVRRRARFQQHRVASCQVFNFFLLLQGKAPKEIHAILTETLACFLPGRAKDLSAPLHAQCMSCKIPVLLRAVLPYVSSQLLLYVR